MKKKEILDIDFDVNNEEELTKLFDKYWGTIYFILLPFLSGISIYESFLKFANAEFARVLTFSLI